MNKETKGGDFFKNACKQDQRLQEMAVEYIQNKMQRLNGLSRSIENPKEALKLIMPHKKDKEAPEFASYYEDKNRVPKCDEVRDKIFYMLALREGAMKKGHHNKLNYKPYFEQLFKKVDNAEKDQAKQKLQDVYGFKLEDTEPVSESDMNSTPMPETQEENNETETDMLTDSSSEKTQSTDAMGGTRKYTKNLCHKKSVKKPNKCKKVKGCKVAKGTKRSYCRKAKNSTKSKKK